MQPQFGGIVELAVAGARLSDGLQHAALHVHHENLVTKRVGNVNALGRGIHGNARGTLEISFATFQAANRAAILAIRIEHKNLARLRISYVDIVLGIDGHALRREHGILPRIAPREEFIFLLLEVEDVHARRRYIGNDDAPA